MEGEEGEEESEDNSSVNYSFSFEESPTAMRTPDLAARLKVEGSSSTNSSSGTPFTTSNQVQDGNEEDVSLSPANNAFAALIDGETDDDDDDDDDDFVPDEEANDNLQDGNTVQEEVDKEEAEEEEEEEEGVPQSAPPETVEQEQARLTREFHEQNPTPDCFAFQHHNALQEDSGHFWVDGNPPATKKVGATSNTEGNVIEYECFNVGCNTGTDNGRAKFTYYSDPKCKFCKLCCNYVLKCKDRLPNIDKNGTGIEMQGGAESHVLKGRRHYCASCSGHPVAGSKRKRLRKKY